MGQKMSNLSRNSVTRSPRDVDESGEKHPRIVALNPIVMPSERTHAMPYRLSLLLDMPAPDKSVVENFKWSDTEKSSNIKVLVDHRRCRRLPVAQSTDCIRGNTGFSSGLHVWEIEWEVKQRGTHAMIGVATKGAPLHCPGYRSLIGSNKESWGWDLGRSKLLHDCIHKPPRTYPRFSNTSVVEDIFSLTDCIKVVLDMDAGTLAFMAGNVYLGVAFTGLCGLTLYPIISAVWGHCEVKIRYINSLHSEVCSLKEMSRHVIRRACRTVSNNNLQQQLHSGTTDSNSNNTEEEDQQRRTGARQQHCFTSSSSCMGGAGTAPLAKVSESNISLLPVPDTLKHYLLS